MPKVRSVTTIPAITPMALHSSGLSRVSTPLAKALGKSSPPPFQSSGRPGVSLLALKEMGGWETLEMVQRYAHLSAGHLTEHASNIDAIIGRNVTNTAQEESGVYLNVR